MLHSLYSSLRGTRRGSDSAHQRPRGGDQRRRDCGGNNETVPETRPQEALVAGRRDVPQNRGRPSRRGTQAREDLFPDAGAGENPVEIVVVVGEEETAERVVWK